MSMNVTPVKAVMSAVNTVAPKSRAAKAINLAESLSIMPKEERKARVKNIIFMVLEQFAQKSKAKSDAERSVIDYVIILADKLKDINPAKYAA